MKYGRMSEQPMCRDFSREQIFLLLRQQLFPFASQLFLVNRAFLFATRMSLLPAQHLEEAGSKQKTTPTPKLASDYILVQSNTAFRDQIARNHESALVFIKQTMTFPSSMEYMQKDEGHKIRWPRARGERIIRYLNIIRILEDKYQYLYSYSGDFLKPNTIHICIQAIFIFR